MFVQTSTKVSTDLPMISLGIEPARQTGMCNHTPGICSNVQSSRKSIQLPSDNRGSCHSFDGRSRTPTETEGEPPRVVKCGRPLFTRLLHYHPECTLDGWGPRETSGSKPTRFATVPHNTTLRPCVCRLQNSHINALSEIFSSTMVRCYSFSTTYYVQISSHTLRPPLGPGCNRAHVSQ